MRAPEGRTLSAGSGFGRHAGSGPEGRIRRGGAGKADAFRKALRADPEAGDPAGGPFSAASVPRRPAAPGVPAAGASGRRRHTPCDTPSR